MSEQTTKLPIVNLPCLPEDYFYGDLTPDGFIKIFRLPNDTISLAYLKNLLSIDPVTNPLTFLAIVLGGVIMQDLKS